ncbi:MAG TPA: hypothetical protein VIT45_16695 [Allosphingosinicella sp.]
MAMDPVSNADRLLQLLRQRLAERARTRGAAAGGRKESAPRGSAGPVDRIETVPGIEDRDGRGARRRVIQALLADQFGKGAINEAEFQQIVDRVVDAIESDPEAGKLMERVLRELG